MALYSFVAEEKADPQSRWSVAEMCRVLAVSRSGFYDWEDRGPSGRELSDAALAVEIEAIFIASDETYGAPRVHAWLGRHGFRVGHNRVARIMAERGWVGEMGRRKVRTTIADKTATSESAGVPALTRSNSQHAPGYSPTKTPSSSSASGRTKGCETPTETPPVERTRVLLGQ